MKLKANRSGKRDQPPRDHTLPEVLLAGESEIQSRWPILLMAAVSLVLSLPLFAPWGFWPAGYVVFVPWLLAISLSSRPAWVYLVSYLLGAGFYLVHFRWLYSTTAPGYLLASLLYVAPLFVPVAWITRHLHKRRGWSLALAFPLAWTAQELAHSRGPLAFPWFLLGHSQYRVLTVIQIADVAGVYGISLVLAALNGLIADLLLRSFFRRRGRKQPELARQFRLAMVLVLGMLVFMLSYGQFRLHQNTIADGPKVAVIQGDYPLVTYSDPNAPSEPQKREAYMRMAKSALADNPDLIAMPETPWSMYLNGEALNRDVLSLPMMHWIKDWTPKQQQSRIEYELAECSIARRELSQLAVSQHVYVVAGAVALELNKRLDKDGKPAYPPFHKFNSAFVFSPQGGEPGRYDKINLVLFGEYVPFRYSCYQLYRFLNDGPWNPWGQGGNEYSVTWGTEYTTFPVPSRSMPGADSRFGVTICYEDVIPQVFRRFILDGEGHKRAGFMLNISNDGWFGYGAQQAQHLVNCAFRAVENRVGIARSVNTGISGFVRPDGSIYDLVQAQKGPLHAGGAGYRTARVLTDSRVTFYSRFGDLLPVGWSLVAVGAMMDAGRLAWKRRRETGRKKRRNQRKGGK